MLEPTTKTESSTADSRPMEITDSNTYLSMNHEQNSLSAYASAETSPTQLTSLGSKPDMRLVDEPIFPKSDTSSSINTYWGLPPASSLLIDEEDKIDALEHSREKLSQSKSFNTSKDLLDNDLVNKEYKSLPATNSKTGNETLKEDEKESTEPGKLKKELSESDLFKLNVVEGEEDLVSVDLTENASLKSEHLPEMSVPKSKSSTFSFIEKMFSSKKTTEETTTEDVKPTLTTTELTQTKPDSSELKSKTTLVTLSSISAASASSPNPECSPYKFLINEYSSKTTEATKTVSSLKLTETNETKDIENLASLNCVDSEKHDPILSGAAKTKDSKAHTSSKTSRKDQTNKSPKPNSNKPTGRSPSKSVSNLPTGEVNSLTKVDNLPASSREFTMNLNFNLASAAAASAGGPIVVVDNSCKSPVAKEHDKFTSNASTSSIHNDLKMILEESKDGKKSGKENKSKKVKESKSEDKLNKSTEGTKKEQKPKPQRPKKENKEKANASNASFNSSTNETTNSMTAETGNMSPTSKANDLNLIKMMMLMVEGSGNTKPQSKKHQLEKSVTDEPSLIQLAKQNGRYKYNKEFLMEIKDKRASFIDQIQPEIFKAYCYCINGKYWDPEKYFDIVQFPDDFDRISSNHRNNYHRSASYNKATSKYNRKNTPNSTFNNNNSYNSKNMSVGTTPTAVQHHMQDESPQPLQVPKNSPKFDNKTKKDHIMESLGLKSKLDADKILLGLIKKEKTLETSNLMNILNKKASMQQSSNILDSLLKVEKKPDTSVQKHYPLILTAQELEMSQFNQEKLSKLRLPNEISMTKLEELQQSMEANDSFAYKQLVKNLSNHPLNSATSLNTKLEASLTKLQARQKMEKSEKLDKSKPSWQVSNDGTNMLKQLLNLKTENVKPKKQKKVKSNKSPHLSMSHGSASSASSAGSSPMQSGDKFPAVNPHEKPFESYMAEENRKQIEQVVTSALNQVLSKSPNSNGAQVMSPKSPIENLLAKINTQNKQEVNTISEHFNSLLDKMNKQQIKQDTNDILKWFNKTNLTAKSNHFSAQTLSEIEFMEMQRPQGAAMNKLF